MMCGTDKLHTVSTHTAELSVVPLVAVETHLMFRDNYLMLGCGDKPEGGVSVEDHNSCSPGGILLLLINLMTYTHTL